MKKYITIIVFVILSGTFKICAQKIENINFIKTKIASLDNPNKKIWKLNFKIKNDSKDTLIILIESIDVLLRRNNLHYKQYKPNFGTPFLPPEGNVHKYLVENRNLFNLSKIDFLVQKIKRCDLIKDDEEILNYAFSNLYFLKSTIIIFPNESIEEERYYKSIWFGKKNKVKIIIPKQNKAKIPIYIKKQERILDLDTCLVE